MHTLFYFASVNKVFAVQVERFNDKSIWVVNGGRRARIGSPSYYPTFEEARADGLKSAENAYLIAKDMLRFRQHAVADLTTQTEATTLPV